MPVTKIGLNLSGMSNVSTPNFNLSTTSKEFIDNIPVKANEMVVGYYGLVALLFTFAYLYWELTDMSEFANFRYSKFRGLSITSGICGIIGIFMINIGYFTNFYHIVIFLVIFAIATIFVWKEEGF